MPRSVDVAFLVIIVVLPSLANATQDQVSTLHNCMTYANQKISNNTLNYGNYFGFLSKITIVDIDVNH